MGLMRIKKALKPLIPANIRRLLSGIYYGWHGDYNSWNEAVERSSGYNSSEILEKVKSASLLVRDGKAAYERDSVLFDEPGYQFELLSMLMWIAAMKGGNLNILDFGGSLGSTFYQNRVFLQSLKNINWCVVEQPTFVETGREHFENESLHFYNSIEECLQNRSIDVVLFSSVLQYLEKPFEILARVAEENIEYLLIDRTPFINGKDRITLQKVSPSIYKASYPCWFFNKAEFINRLPEYKLLVEFNALDRSNIRSEFLGMIFKHN